MPTDLSTRSKQAFQIASLIATVMVVGIHYKSDVPNSSIWSQATWNQLLQEFWFGGVARVAVPMFAFIAGLLYFRSDDGTWISYQAKLQRRCRTLALPYFIVASLAVVCWLAVQHLKTDPISITWPEFLTTWLLHPPAGQLWFLRDLMVLVLIAPVIRIATSTSRRSQFTLIALSLCWAINYQPAPILADWYVLNIETLLFFTFGCVACRQYEKINGVVNLPSQACGVLGLVWLCLVAVRVWLRPDFDIWYTNVHGWIDLGVHQLSIVIGCVALLSLSGKVSSSKLQQISGASFFVFLVHEFPLRAAIEKIVDRTMDPSLSCWIIVPLVVVVCFSLGVWGSARFPSALQLLTGGRTPKRAAKILSETAG